MPRSEVALSDVLQRMFLCCLLYRLGGEQSFTPEEIDNISAEYQGVRFYSDGEKITLRIQNKDAAADALREGRTL